MAKGTKKSKTQTPVEEQIEKQDEKVEIIQEKKYSPLVLETWRKYLEKYKLTPEQFLTRYPNHPEKDIIKQL